MELIPVSCNHCGAPIQVPSSARFVTCAHCDSQLAIKSTGSATYTEVLEVLDGRRSDPSVAGSWLMGLFFGIGGCIAMAVGASARQAGPLMVIGLVAAFG